MNTTSIYMSARATVCLMGPTQRVEREKYNEMRDTICFNVYTFYKSYGDALSKLTRERDFGLSECSSESIGEILPTKIDEISGYMLQSNCKGYKIIIYVEKNDNVYHIILSYNSEANKEEYKITLEEILSTFRWK